MLTSHSTTKKHSNQSSTWTRWCKAAQTSAVSSYCLEVQGSPNKHLCERLPSSGKTGEVLSQGWAFRHQQTALTDAAGSELSILFQEKIKDVQCKIKPETWHTCLERGGGGNPSSAVTNPIPYVFCQQSSPAWQLDQATVHKSTF